MQVADHLRRGCQILVWMACRLLKMATWDIYQNKQKEVPHVCTDLRRAHA